MSITTYATLQTAVANWLEREDLTDRIPEFIALAEGQMNRALRVNRMLKRATATITDGFSAVPSDHLQPRSMRDSDERLLQFITPEQMSTIKALDTGGPLAYFALVGTEFEYAPVPDDGEEVTLTYYSKIPALSDSNTDNWVLTAHPDAYLFGAVMEAAIYLQDGAMAQAAQSRFAGALDAIRAADVRDVWAANITPQPGAFAI